ncbi:MAG TPA: GNAT family N-acetyltransferase [Candidatus Paceibacterota bacterium]
MTYLNWDTQIISDFSVANIEAMYDKGYVFTRVDRGVMNKTRSFRIDLGAYVSSSENRRIMRKSEHLALSAETIPYADYSWKIGKLAKDFYEKFGDNVFSANKTKEIVTDAAKSNFNKLLVFTDTRTDSPTAGQPVGYVICAETADIIHYSFPFYIEDASEPSRGLGMMTKAIEWAKASGKKYMYLGSLQRPSDTYKLQFLGGEWFDGETWRADTAPLKEILK